MLRLWGLKGLTLLMLIVVLVCRATQLRAQGFPALSGVEVGVALHVVDHPALSDAFTERARQRVEQMLQTLLGPAGQIQAVESQPLKQWLRTRELGQLTPELAEQFGLKQSEKVLVLDVRFERGSYRLSAFEFDRHFDEFSPLRVARVLQRELVPDTLGRLALRSWSPVGEVLSRRDDATCEIDFPQTAQLRQVAPWSGLEPGAVLQLFREVRTREGIRQRPRTDQFLVIDAVTDVGVEAHLAMAEAAGQPNDWFQYLGHPSARYLARRVSPPELPLTARVEFRDSGIPREGCEIAVADSLLSTPKTLGHTGPNGELRMPSHRGLQFVTVRYDNQKLTRLCVPGVTHDPLLFQLAPRHASNDMRAELTRLEDRLRDTVAVLNDLIAQMNEASQLKDVPKLEELMGRMQREVKLAELKVEAAALKSRVPATEPASGTRIDGLIASIDRTIQQQRQGDFDKTLNSARAEVLKQQIAAAHAESRWAEAGQLLQEYVKLVPGDATAASRLTELTAGLPAANDTHRDARAAIDQHRGLNRIQDLLDQWSTLHPALNVLLTRNDRLWLTTANKEFDAWATLLNDEGARIRQIADSGTTLSQDEQDELAARAKAIEGLGNELTDVITKTETLLGN